MIKKLGLIFILLLSLNSVIAEENIKLGKISFHTTSNPRSQQAFENGLLLLHSFEYEHARQFFREAEKIDPQNVMAYWGEAMTYNHPVWNEQDINAANAVLATLDAKTNHSHLPKKETGLINAIHLLYDNHNKAERDLHYANAMHALYQQNPNDDEIAAFYALALLGTTEGSRDFATYMHAAAILEEVFARNPYHPGATHYLIHSYDDAIHAPLGLRAARVYAKIAPAASHALHMPSHIFLALGMWDELIASNQAAWSAGESQRALLFSKQKSDKQGQPQKKPFYHSLSDDLHALEWLTYGYLQKKEYQKANQAVRVAYQFVQLNPSPMTKWYYGLMRAMYINESYDWQTDLPTVDMKNMSLLVQSNDIYINVMIGLHNNFEEKKLTAMINQFVNNIPPFVPANNTASSYYTSITEEGIAVAKMIVAELRAQIKIKHGQINEAIEELRQACQIEDLMPLRYGPPYPIKPPHELLAEAFIQKQDYAAAYKQYQSALKHAPGRTIAKDGLNRAAKYVSSAESATVL